MTLTGTIFDIQRFSIHDGPGIRTTVFFKGCPLRCLWCHNPEGLHRPSEIQFDATRCTGCGACVLVCPQHAQEWNGTQRVFHRERCTACGQCAEACFSGALQKVGREMTPPQVMDEILADRAFYAAGGGVTLSGGEPLLQPAFAAAVLERCRAVGIHTAVETTTCCSWEMIESILPLVDLLMVDIKHLDPARHLAATGVSNEKIIENIRRLAATGRQIAFRVPVIPGINASLNEIEAIAAFVYELGQIPLADGSVRPERFSLELLAFHKLAAGKYHSLGMPYPAEKFEPVTKEEIAALGRAAAKAGIPVVV